MSKPVRVTSLLTTAMVLCLAATLLTSRAAVSQDKPPAEKAADTAKPESQPAEGKKAKPEKSKGRLPPYFAEVVDQKQREEIYRIQEEFGPKIDALKAQLAALAKDRDEKIAAVLTPEQAKKLGQLRDAAKAKRAASAEKKPAKPPESKPVEPKS